MDESPKEVKPSLSANQRRYVGHIGFLLAVVLSLVAVRFGLGAISSLGEDDLAKAPAPAEASELALPDYEPPSDDGLRRAANVHTLIPTRDRFTILKYVVQAGDSLFGISNRFGLEPETVLWGNFDILEDNIAQTAVLF